MGERPLQQCLKPGCGVLTRDRYCPAHKPEPAKYQSQMHSMGYKRWRAERAEFLSQHPWCVECLKKGRLVQATDVDHITPHKGSQELFWNRNNWQPLCHRHHSIKTAREDRG